MVKEEKRDLQIVWEINHSDFATVYLLDDNRVYKEFNPLYLKCSYFQGVDLEAKIDDSVCFKGNNEFILPLTKVYDDGVFVGYTMEYILDINFTDYDDTLTKRQKQDLYLYRDNYRKLESTVKKGNSLGMVFPDLCTSDNIYITSEGDFRLGDYDGFQVKKHPSNCISSDLGNIDKLFVPKFFKNDLFTLELDKYSLMVLYFLDVFNSRVNGNLFTSDFNLLDYLNKLGITEPDIIEMIVRTMSFDMDGAYVSEFSTRLAQSYTLKPVKIGEGQYINTLVKKQ